MPVLSPIARPADTAFWRIADFGFFSHIGRERHEPFFYPTAEDWHPAGYFTLDPLNNAFVADMNGDGHLDLVVNPALFPHTVARAPLLPLLFLSDGLGGFRLDDWLSRLPEAPRHFNYRLEVADLDRDGYPDYLSPGAGYYERLADGTMRGFFEPISWFRRADGGWVDASRQIEGQAGLVGGSSPHDLAVGDIDGDGWLDFSAGGVVFLNDRAGGFARLDVDAAGLSTNVMTSVIADLDGDGFGDLVLWFADGAAKPGLVLFGSPAGVDPGRTAPVPEGPFGRGTKFNDARAADLDGDGRPDAVVGVTRADPYYVGREVRILINRDGQLVDETALRLPPDPRFTSGSGEGQVFLVDVNGDGHLDIVDAGGINYDASEDHMRILLNDGEGFFVDMPLAAIPHVEPWQIEGNEDLEAFFARGKSKLVPIDIDGRHGIDWVSMVHGVLREWPQTEPTQITLFSVMSTARFGKAGDGLEGWQAGAPGFDEAYYLRSNPDVSALVAGGLFASAIDHYLAAGRAEGRAAFAPGTVVWTSATHRELRLDAERATVAVAREGDAIVVRTASGVERHDTVSVLRFEDGSLLFDLAGDDAKAAWRLYGGAFDRVPDEAGLRHWAMVRESGLSMVEIAAMFVASNEFEAVHGRDQAPEAFVEVLYRYVLDRSADGVGLAFWTGMLEGGATRAEVLLAVTQSPEFASKTAADTDVGLWVL